MRDRAAHAWVLWSVLVAQAVLTLPWLWRTAPFTDEALYLQAGHQEWSHWLGGAVLPDYAAWFSGVPVLYPPLGAAADSVGGLAGARGLSLIMMLATTCLVYLAASQLFGRQVASFASALFAISGLVVHNGAFATFNPLAMFLLALGLWAAVKAGSGGYLVDSRVRDRPHHVERCQVRHPGLGSRGLRNRCPEQLEGGSRRSPQAGILAGCNGSHTAGRQPDAGRTRVRYGREGDDRISRHSFWETLSHPRSYSGARSWVNRSPCGACDRGG